MNALICTAIRERRRLAFTYHGRARVAEPQCYGISPRRPGPNYKKNDSAMKLIYCQL